MMTVALIGLLMAAGLVLIGCGPDCPGNGECTVTINQGSSGLFVDYTVPPSTCGKSAEWDADLEMYMGGCEVQNNIDNRKNDRKFGTHGCDC